MRGAAGDRIALLGYLSTERGLRFRVTTIVSSRAKEKKKDLFCSWVCNPDITNHFPVMIPLHLYLARYRASLSNGRTRTSTKRATTVKFNNDLVVPSSDDWSDLLF
jgi:hypothetical protein